MRKRNRQNDETLPPTPRDDRRMKLRREVLRNLQITELKVVVGGATCPVSRIPPI